MSISGLPLIAYKVGPNLFDLSSKLHHVSMRDQIHRAVALAEALVAGNQFKSNRDQVLIVGAGVAGVVAGMVLARHGVQVQIVDTSKDAPFSLQRNTNTRFVGPYMYEWPLNVYDSQFYPPGSGASLFEWGNNLPSTLPFSQSNPSCPSALVASWDVMLDQAITASMGKLRLQVGIDGNLTNREVKKWLHRERLNDKKRSAKKSRTKIHVYGGQPWKSSQNPLPQFMPKCVLLAAGMGSETNTATDNSGNKILTGSPFWQDDTILNNNCGSSAPPRVIVLGGGDGALQDTLRSITKHDHPLKTWADILQKLKTSAKSTAKLNSALADIQAMEIQHSLGSIWGAHEPSILDRGYESLASALIQDKKIAAAVLSCVRSDVWSVHLCIKDAYFSKCYSLNRFLVHLFEQCAKNKETVGGVRFLTVLRGVTISNVYPQHGAKLLIFNNTPALVADIVIVRFGSDADSLPGQWLGLTIKDTMNRHELAAVPLPLYLPPSK